MFSYLVGKYDSCFPKIVVVLLSSGTRYKKRSKCDASDDFFPCFYFIFFLIYFFLRKKELWWAIWEALTRAVLKEKERVHLYQYHHSPPSIRKKITNKKSNFAYMIALCKNHKEKVLSIADSHMKRLPKWESIHRKTNKKGKSKNYKNHTNTMKTSKINLHMNIYFNTLG